MYLACPWKVHFLKIGKSFDFNDLMSKAVFSAAASVFPARLEDAAGAATSETLGTDFAGGNFCSLCASGSRLSHLRAPVLGAALSHLPRPP